MYTRPSASDYDDWVNVYKNPGWGYKDMLPFFKKVSRHTVVMWPVFSLLSLLSVRDVPNSTRLGNTRLRWPFEDFQGRHTRQRWRRFPASRSQVRSSAWLHHRRERICLRMQRIWRKSIQFWYRAVSHDMSCEIVLAKVQAPSVVHFVQH